MKLTLGAIAATLLLSTAVVHAQAIDDHVRAYLECAKLAIPTTDDRVSDANTVATGLHGQCRTSFVDVGMSQQRQEHMAEVLRPTLVQLVLLSRTAAARAGKPAKTELKRPNL